MASPDNETSECLHNDGLPADHRPVQASTWLHSPSLHSVKAGLPTYASTLSLPNGASSFLPARDLQSFIEHVCELLVSQLGVYNVWIALMDGMQVTVVASSFRHGFEPLRERLLRGFCPHCMQEVINHDHIELMADPHRECGACPLADTYHGRAGMAVRITEDGRMLGVLCVSVPDVLIDDDMLHKQVTQAAKDVARELVIIEEREALIKSEELVHSIFRAAPVGIGLLRGGVIREVNETLCLMTGYQRAELIGMSFDRLFASDEDVGRMNECLEKILILPVGVSTETRWRCKSGAHIMVRVGVTPLDLSDPEKGITFSTLDITREKENEFQLQEGRRLLASLMDSLPGMAFRCKLDEQWTMVFVSNGCKELTGYDAGDLLGNRRISYAEIIYPDDRLRVFQEISKVRDHEAYTLEYRICLVNGDVRWVWERGKVVADAESSDKMVEGFIIDITDRKNLDDHIIQLKKNESLSVMAGGVAHDFNNILASIIGNSELALVSMGDNREARVCLKHIIESGEKAASLCRKLLYFCGRTRMAEQSISVNHLVLEIASLLQETLSPEVQLDIRVGENVPPILADIAEIRQILIQLLLNAAESYGGEPGVIRVATGSEYLNGKPLPHLIAMEDVPAGLCCWLQVSDHGVGMDDQVQARMFDPFFSTKFTGRGMGLAAVQGIVTSLHGCITVVSAPGKGTSVTVYFPVSDAPAKRGAATPAPPVEPTDRREVKTVLVVDDDVILRNLTSAMLEHAGVRVITAVDGLDGCEVYRQRYRDIDLVLMDLTMPRMDGVEAALQMRSINPKARIVFATGYSEEDVTSRIEASAIEGVLVKPYTREDVLRFIQPAQSPSRPTKNC